MFIYFFVDKKPLWDYLRARLVYGAIVQIWGWEGGGTVTGWILLCSSLTFLTIGSGGTGMQANKSVFRTNNRKINGNIFLFLLPSFGTILNKRAYFLYLLFSVLKKK